MADESKKILIEVDLKVKEAIANLAVTRKQIADLRAEQIKLDTSTEEGRAMYEAYNAEIRKLTATARDQQKQIDNTIKANNAEKESLAQLKAQLSLLTADYNKLSAEQRQAAKGQDLKNQIKGISDQLKETEAGIGLFQRRVGDYENAIKNALGTNKGFAGTIASMQEEAKGAGLSFGQYAVQGVQAFAKSLLSLMANPIVAVIAAIAAVIMLVVDAIKSNGTATAQLNQVLAPFKNLLEMVMTAIGQLVGWLLKGVVALEGWANSIMSLIPGLDKLAEKNREAIAIEQEKQALSAKNRQNQIQDSKDELAIAELKNKSRQKDKFGIQDRLSFLKQADAMELAMSQRKADFATAKLNERLAEMKLEGKAYKDLTKDEKDAYTQLVVNINNAKKEYFESTLRIKSQESNLIQQDASEKKAAYQKSVEAAKQAAQQRLEIEKAIQKAQIELYDLQKSSVIEKQKSIMDDEKQSYSNRYSAAVAYETESTALINKKYDYELSSSENISKLKEARLKGDKKLETLYAKLVADETAVINQKRANDLEKLHNDTTKSIESISKKELEDTLKRIEKSGAEQKVILAQQAQDEETALAKKFADGKIKREDYEKAKSAIVEKYHQKDFDSTLEYLNKELQQNNLTAEQRLSIEKAIADAKKKYADQAAADEIKINEESAKQREDREKKLVELKKSLYKELQDSIKGVLDGILDNVVQNYESEITAVSNTKEKEVAKIEAAEKAGTMSSTKATKAKQAAEDKAAADTTKLEKKKKQAAVEKAIFDRGVSAFNVILSTKEAIAKSVAASPLTAGQPWATLSAIIGGLQIAAIMAAPLPKASRGLLLSGPSHAQGGIPIEAEGGEVIINKRSSAMFRPLLSAINEAGGGVKFASGGVVGMYASGGAIDTRFTNDGGYSARNNSTAGLTKDDVEDAMVSAVSKIRVYTSIEEIRQVDLSYTVLDNMFNK